MKKIKKKWIVLGVIVVVIAGMVIVNLNKGGKTILSVQASTLKQTALSNTISTTGVVQSTDNVNVYTNLNYSIKTVGVKVGDRVNVGDVLCQLDTQDLLDTITQKEAGLRSSAAASSQKIKTSQKKYSDTKSNLDAGLNTQINAAQDKVDSSNRDLLSAQQKLSDEKKHIEDNTNTSLITAKASVTSAKLALDSAQRAYDDAKKYYKDNKDEASKDTLDTAREKMQSAQATYDSAVKTLNALNTASDEELAQYQTTVNTAQASYDSAVKSLKTTQTSVNQDLQDTQQGITSDQISADDTAQRAELASLRIKVVDCTVAAPASGTVTAVYAVKNATANGLLFVIEDTGALKIGVQVKEYDIGSLKEGMKVIVKSDSTGDDQYEGIVQKIAPTAEKSTDGKTVSNTDVEFDVDVIVSSKNTRLKIGMNARAEIIVEQKNSVFAVPTDSVTTDVQDKDIIYIAKQQKDGTYQAEAIPVTTGIETDAQVEIIGDGLKDGLQIIADSKLVKTGQTVTLGGSGTAAAAKSSNAGLMRVKGMG